MPKVTLTEAARRVEAERQRQKRVKTIITTAATMRGLNTKELAAKTGIEYQGLCKRLRGAADFRLAEIATVSDVLGLDGQTRAALAGAKEKCRYEIGYQT